MGKKLTCLDCAFAFESEQPGPVTIGEKLYVCKFMPPSPLVVPNGKGIAITALFPPVNADMSCAQLTERQTLKLT